MCQNQNKSRWKIFPQIGSGCLTSRLDFFGVKMEYITEIGNSAEVKAEMLVS
jgi:hypothetical protein